MWACLENVDSQGVPESKSIILRGCLLYVSS